MRRSRFDKSNPKTSLLLEEYGTELLGQSETLKLIISSAPFPLIDFMPTEP